MPTRRSTFQIDAALGRIALRQLGLVTAEQAARAGVDKFALWRRRDAGTLLPVFADVMRLAAAPASAEQRILAAALAVPGSMVAATSAGVVHGMPVGTGVRSPVVAIEAERSARTRGIVTVRQRVALPDQPWHTSRVASPASALVLLPRFLDEPVVERCIDHCLAHRLTTVARVQQLIHGLPQRAVIGRRFLLDLLDQRSSGIGHRSALEQRVARWLDHAGLVGWQRNYPIPVGDAGTVEVDFAWPAAAVALEVSPFFTHGSRTAQERDAARRALLTAQRWATVEATDPDLTDRRAFERCVTTLRGLLAPTASRALGGVGRYRAHTTHGPKKAG